MRAYTFNDLAAIVTEAFRRGVETGRTLHPDSPMPAPPQVHEIVDHPFDSSDAPGQTPRPWLDPGSKRRRGTTDHMISREGDDADEPA